MVLIPADYAQANLIYTGISVPTGAQCTFGIQVSGVAGGPAVVAALIRDAYGTSGIGALLANGNDMTAVMVKFGPTSTGPSAVVAAGSTSAGGAAGPPNTAWLVNKSTEFGGRAGRGRMFLPGVPEGVVDGSGQISSTAVTGMQSAMTTFLGKLETDELGMWVLHGEGSPLSSPSQVDALQVQTLAATQRRRLRR